MSFDPARIAAVLNAWWESHGGWITLAGLVAAIAILWLLLRIVARWVQTLAGTPDIKMHAGFAIVQAGVTAAVVTGVYEAATRIFDAGLAEALIIAVFAEATVWVAVGRIRVHARKKPGKGVGLAGRLFWIATIGSGALAAIGSSSTATAAGRIIIVTIGTALWWERIREWVPATGKRSRWRWTPKQLLTNWGVLAPEADDLLDEPEEWQVRQIARALRWLNGGRRWAWLGRRALARRAAEASEEALAKGRRRWAAGEVLVRQGRADSALMQAVLADVERAARAVDTGWTAVTAQGWTTPAVTGGHPVVNGVDMSTFVGAVNGRPAGGEHVQSSAAVESAVLSTEQERLMSTLAAVDSDGRWRYPTHKDLARRLRTSPKTVSRRLSDLRALYGVKTDGQLRDIATGQNPPARVDSQVDKSTGHEVDNSVDTTGGHDRTARVDNRPDTQVDITAGGDRS